MADPVLTTHLFAKAIVGASCGGAGLGALITYLITRNRRTYPTNKIGDKGFDTGALTEIFGGVFVSIVLFLLGLDKTLIEITLFLGPALSGSRYLIMKEMKEQLFKVKQLAQMVDLQHDLDVVQLQSSIKAYYEIIDDEFQSVKDQIVEEATGRLLMLAKRKRSDDLATGEYYRWLLPMIRDAAPASRIWAISLMLESEWNESPSEEQFITLNVQAAERGVIVERIFIVGRSELHNVMKVEGVSKHINASHKSLNSWVVFKEDLVRDDPKLLDSADNGFIAFDDRVALIDIFSPSGPRGYVTTSDGEIHHIQKVFEQLRTFSRTWEEAVKLVNKNLLSSPTPPLLK